MRFGSYVEFQCPPGADHAELIWDVISVAEQSDQLGYDVFTCLEHSWFEQFAIMPAPLPLFTMLGQRTRNLTFRALCHTLPLHNPMVLAGEIAEADILLNGRLEVGVGRGHAWLQEPSNVVLEENVERYAEAFDILIKAWTEDRFSYDGRYYQARDLQVVPKPLQRPHPRIFQVGTSAKWFQRAAENGYALVLGGFVPAAAMREPVRLYRELCATAGTEPFLGWIKTIYLDEDEGRAHEEAREHVMRFIEYNLSPLKSLARETPEEKQRLIDAGYGFYAGDDFASLEALTYEQLVDGGLVLVGTPAQVGERLMDLWREFRFDELLTMSHFGGTARWQAMKTQKLFARDIMPMLREASVAVTA
jgi:alkanesulfonate monooxygenase SsuD/methylene tetrahydromethanopterin reductase-like flavin-dependent oxidoreductase (luciferase family)